MYASNVQVFSTRLPDHVIEWLRTRAAEDGISQQAAVVALIQDAIETGVRFQSQPPKVIR
jgi:plasmid stability protein